MRSGYLQRHLFCHIVTELNVTEFNANDLNVAEHNVSDHNTDDHGSNDHDNHLIYQQFQLILFELGSNQCQRGSLL